jgi:hypothetical protein
MPLREVPQRAEHPHYCCLCLGEEIPQGEPVRISALESEENDRITSQTLRQPLFAPDITFG